MYMYLCTCSLILLWPYSMLTCCHSCILACEEELRNGGIDINLPIVCPNNVCLVIISTGYSYNRYECNGVTECGDCSDECHCSFNAARVGYSSCRVSNATITLCGEEIVI